MNASPSHVDPKSLSALSAYWLHRTQGKQNIDFEQDAAEAASDMVEIKPFDRSFSADAAFDVGFGLAIKIASPVIADPFGDPKTAIESACWIARQEVSHYRDDQRIDAINDRVETLEQATNSAQTTSKATMTP